MSDSERKKLRKLRRRFRESSLRRIPDIRLVRIGDTVSSITGFPMQVTGIFQSCIDSKDGTLYLDFKENEGDVWEEELVDVEFRGFLIGVVIKKIFRRLC